MHYPPPRYSSSRPLLPTEFDFDAPAGPPLFEEQQEPAVRGEDSGGAGEFASQSSEVPHARQAPTRQSLARLALGAGTGQDVADFNVDAPRSRWRLNGKARGALAVALALLLAVFWGKNAIAGAAHGEPASSVAAAPSAIAPAQGQASARPEEAASGAQAAPSPTTGTGTTAPGAGGLVVYVTGAVASPGVYTLEGAGRVNDVVTLAGGLAQSADGARVNLAAPVTDGEHVHIPAQGETASPELGSSEQGTPGGPGAGGAGQTAAGAPGSLVNINAATAQELQSLPGIGPALGAAIVTWREENGGFRAIDDLLEVSGIGQAKFAQLRDKVSLG